MQLMNMPGKISLLFSTSPSPPQPQYIIIFLPPWIWCSLDLYWISEDIKTWIFGISLSFVALLPIFEVKPLIHWNGGKLTLQPLEQLFLAQAGLEHQPNEEANPCSSSVGTRPQSRSSPHHSDCGQKKKGPYLVLRPQSKRLRAESLPYRLVFKKTKQSWGPC